MCRRVYLKEGVSETIMTNMPRFSLNLELFTSDWFNTHRSEDLPEVVTVAHLKFFNDPQK